MAKIIERLSDSELEQLFRDYNYENIIIYPSEGKPLYVIPKILALGEIYRSDWIHCSKSEDGVVYSGSYLPKWMGKMTGLTTQEYFDLLVLHINDTELRPKCSNCGEPIHWSGSIRCGYGSHGHLWDDSPYHFCSRQCAATFQWSCESYSDTMVEFKKTGGTFGNMKDEVFCNMLIESRKTNLIRQGGLNDVGMFYVTWTDKNYFKFGVTFNMGYRVSYSRFVDHYRCPHILKRGTRLELAELEAKIKYDLKQFDEYILPEKVSEFWKSYRKHNA